MASAINIYLCPVIRVITNGVTSIEPSILAAAQSSGHQSCSVIRKGNLPYCILVVRSSNFSVLNSHPDAFSITSGVQARMDATLSSLDSIGFNSLTASVRGKLTAYAAQMGLTKSFVGASQGVVMRDLIRHQNPFFNEFAFDQLVPELKSSITDNFDRVDSSTLGSGWLANEVGMWSIVTNAAKGFTTAFNSVIRSEASFPNDQYAQADHSGTTATPGVIIRSPGVGLYPYYVFRIANSTTLDLREMTSYEVTSFLTSWAITDAAPRTVKGQAAAAVLTGFFNGTQLSPSHTDASPINSGIPGMFDASNFVSHDNFECTAATSTTTFTPVGGMMMPQISYRTIII